MVKITYYRNGNNLYVFHSNNVTNKLNDSDKKVLSLCVCFFLQRTPDELSSLSAFRRNIYLNKFLAIFNKFFRHASQLAEPL
jgi:hypothetical protein